MNLGGHQVVATAHHTDYRGNHGHGRDVETVHSVRSGETVTDLVARLWQAQDQDRTHVIELRIMDLEDKLECPQCEDLFERDEFCARCCQCIECHLKYDPCAESPA